MPNVDISQMGAGLPPSALAAFLESKGVPATNENVSRLNEALYNDPSTQRDLMHFVSQQGGAPAPVVDNGQTYAESMRSGTGGASEYSTRQAPSQLAEVMQAEPTAQATPTVQPTPSAPPPTDPSIPTPNNTNVPTSDGTSAEDSDIPWAKLAAGGAVGGAAALGAKYLWDRFKSEAPTPSQPDFRDPYLDIPKPTIDAVEVDNPGTSLNEYYQRQGGPYQQSVADANTRRITAGEDGASRLITDKTNAVQDTTPSRTQKSGEQPPTPRSDRSLTSTDAADKPITPSEVINGPSKAAVPSGPPPEAPANAQQVGKMWIWPGEDFMVLPNGKRVQTFVLSDPSFGDMWVNENPDMKMPRIKIYALDEEAQVLYDFDTKQPVDKLDAGSRKLLKMLRMID